MLYWNGNGKYQSLYTTFSERYVPMLGEADTFRGEVLRCMSNLYYDYYNNALCNDKSDEVNFIYGCKKHFRKFLQKDGLSFLIKLREQYRDEEWIEVDFDNKEDDEALDDLVDAILLFVQEDERKEIASIPPELRLTDSRKWVREYECESLVAS